MCYYSGRDALRPSINQLNKKSNEEAINRASRSKYQSEPPPARLFFTGDDNETLWREEEGWQEVSGRRNYRTGVDYVRIIGLFRSKNMVLSTVQVKRGKGG